MVKFIKNLFGGNQEDSAKKGCCNVEIEEIEPSEPSTGCCGSNGKTNKEGSNSSCCG